MNSTFSRPPKEETMLRSQAAAPSVCQIHREWIESQFDLCPSDVEVLLTRFISGALGVTLVGRLNNLGDLPRGWRTHLQLAEDSGYAWVAWSTSGGPIAVCGKFDPQGSRRINAYLLLVEWRDTLSGHHSVWCYCDPKRLTEWTIGRGRHNEAR